MLRELGLNTLQEVRMSDVAIIIVVMSSGLAFTLGFVFGRVTGGKDE